MARTEFRRDILGAFELSMSNSGAPATNRPLSRCKAEPLSDGTESTITDWENLWVDLGGEG